MAKGNGKSQPDEALTTAKKKLSEKIEAADNVADLCKLCDTLAKLKEVELKSNEGAFGSDLK